MSKEKENFVEFYNNSDENDEFAAGKLAMSLSLLDKPFGMLWDIDKMEKFLKHRGYVIIERCISDDDPEATMKVAVKPGSDVIPMPESGSIRKIFVSEIQDAILEKLM